VSLRAPGGTNIGQGSTPAQKIADVQLKSEREYWSSKCMEEIHNLEKATAEKLRNIENRMLDHIVSEVRRQTSSQVDHSGRSPLSGPSAANGQAALQAMREEHRAAIAELRKDLGVHSDLRSELSDLRDNLSSTRGTVEHLSQRASSTGNAADDRSTVTGAAGLSAQVAALEAAVADTRRDVMAISETRGLVGEAVSGELTKLRVELTASQETQVRALRDDLGRSAAEIAKLTNTASSLQSELRRGVEAVRADAEGERIRLDQHVAHVGQVETSAMELAHSLEEATRKIGELKQDTMSEIVVVRGRLEATIGERDEHVGRIAAIKKEQAERAADLSVLKARLNAVEQQAGSFEAAVGEHKQSVEASTKATRIRLEAVESQCRGTATASPLAEGKATWWSGSFG
jgi:chromosome segregation ATPase